MTKGRRWGTGLGLMFHTRSQLPTPSLQPTPHAHPSNDMEQPPHLSTTTFPQQQKYTITIMARRLGSNKHVQGGGLKGGEVARVVVPQRHRQLPLPPPITYSTTNTHWDATGQLAASRLTTRLGRGTRDSMETYPSHSISHNAITHHRSILDSLPRP